MVPKRNQGEQRDFGRLAKVAPKPLDRAQQICDTTAHETSERKNIRRLSDRKISVLRFSTLTTEEWKAEQQLEQQHT
ncbi:hypothetical protein KDH_49310 [Dictyobacter sp. S3.2.2.5]|uniref:Uncharacterized protein n=1 Tax=Dictyobacter halimunensis TaxID=3026934 RepID=A0ABQ6G0B2_9CHLR|nr:hypothetical protein KDH_49310 [Dictyobacter sp. S3.2.2.5]